MQHENQYQREDLLTHLIKTKGIERGDFTLSSGRKSDIYFNMKNIILDIRGAALVADLFIFKMLDHLEEDGMPIDVIGSSLGTGPLLGTMLNRSLLWKRMNPYRDLRGMLIRNAPKGHGLKKQVEWEQIHRSRTLLIDDVMTTGDSMLDLISAAEIDTAIVSSIYCIIDRGDVGSQMTKMGYRFYSIFNEEDFAQ